MIFRCACLKCHKIFTGRDQKAVETASKACEKTHDKPKAPKSGKK